MVGAKQKLGVGWRLRAKLALKQSRASDVTPAAPGNLSRFGYLYMQYSDLSYIG